MAEKPDDDLDPNFDPVVDHDATTETLEVIDTTRLMQGISSPAMIERRNQKKKAFLKAFADVGTILHAAKLVNISYRVVYLWMEADPEFAAQVVTAREAATDTLEAECRRRAAKGVKEPVYYQGEVVGYIRKYSDLCLLALLNAYRPEKFKHRHEHTGKDGGPIAVVHVSYDFNMKPDDM